MTSSIESRSGEWHDPPVVLTEGKKIALRREALRLPNGKLLSQARLAVRAGVGTSVVWKIENDKNVRVDMLRKVEIALADAERELGGGPSLSPPEGIKGPSLKEGALDAESQQKLRNALRRFELAEDFLSQTLDGVRRGIADLTDTLREIGRKQG